MTSLVLLRAINVGGKNKISSAEQKTAFEDCGATNVRTYLQTGNIVCDGEFDVNCVGRKLKEITGSNIEIFSYDFDTIKDLVESQPFTSGSDHYFIAIRDELVDHPKRFSGKDTRNMGTLEIIGCEKGYLLASFTRIPGKTGYSPNLLIEKLTNQPATTRKWNTLVRIVNKFG